MDITPGALTRREGYNFGVDRDEADAFGPNGTVGGNSADLLGANVLIPEGMLAPGGMTFSGMTSAGAFSGVFVNRIGRATPCSMATASSMRKPRSTNRWNNA